MERPSQSEWLLPEIRGRSTMRYTKSSSISAGSAFVGVVRSSTHHTHTLTPNERYQVVSAVRKIHDTTPYMQQAANVWHWHYKHAYTCIERKTRRLIIKFNDALFLFSNILCALDREKSGSMCINKIACINSEIERVSGHRIVIFTANPTYRPCCICKHIREHTWRAYACLLNLTHTGECEIV